MAAPSRPVVLAAGPYSIDAVPNALTPIVRAEIAGQLALRRASLSGQGILEMARAAQNDLRHPILREARFRRIRLPIAELVGTHPEDQTLGLSAAEQVAYDTAVTALAARYRAHQTVDPIIVTRVPEGGYGVVDGLRRLAAQRRAELTEVEAFDLL